MSAPYSNSKAIKVALVVDGKGYVEIVSPYVSDGSRQGREEEQEETVSYQRLGAQLSDCQGFIVPAGHPFVVVADHGQGLLVLSFDIKIASVNKNEKYPLAGRENIYNEMNRAERELFFKESERVVERVLKAQKEAASLMGLKEDTRGRAKVVLINE